MGQKSFVLEMALANSNNIFAITHVPDSQKILLSTLFLQVRCSIVQVGMAEYNISTGNLVRVYNEICNMLLQEDENCSLPRTSQILHEVWTII